MDSGQHAEPRRSGAFRTILSLLVMVAFVFGLSWALRTFVFQPYEIPSGSMENTIMTGDMVFSEKISYYLRDPEPGDIVTFQDPEIPGRVLIKRCIAVGGQTVDLVDGRVVVDGVALDEPYTRGPPLRAAQDGARRGGVLPLHRARGAPVGHGGQPHELQRLALLRRYRRGHAHRTRRARVLAVQQLRPAGLAGPHQGSKPPRATA